MVQVKTVIRSLLEPALFLTAPVLTWAQSPIHQFDIYRVGVRSAELSITGGTAPVYSIRKKDLAANTWSPVHTATASRVPTDTSFLLWGAVREFPARMTSLQSIDWTSLELVGWPDRTTTYERSRELSGTVDGRPSRAARWNQKDASRPMDLIIGTDNRLIAAIDPSSDIVLVRRGSEDFTTVGRWIGPGISPARFGYRALELQMAPMADGVRLATLVFLPSGEGATGPFPTIFIRTPYGISRLINGYWHYAARGYAVVLQAARGTGAPDARSEGELSLMINEPADGKAALEWITRQSWSNRSICMQGGSYVGYTQWTAAMSGNPALKCLVPESSMGTAFADQPYVGGGMLVGMAYYTFWMHQRELLPGRTWTDVLAHRPLVTLDDFGTGATIPDWDRLVTGAINGPAWKGQDWHHAPIRPELGTLQISGWFDDDLPGTLSNWSLMSRIGTAPQRLILGPWKHGYNVDRALNGYSYGLDALRDDIWLLKQQWYDHFLKGMDNGVTRPRVDYFVLGENRWRTAGAWPPAEAELQRWYFHSDGNAHRRFPSGRLTREAPATDEPADRYQYDPKDPPPNWMSFELMQNWEDVQTFQWDMKDIEARHDVVTYTSEPLERDLTIAGDILAVVYASTDAKDTDWWVHVSDVDEKGRSNRLTLGTVRARFRNLEDPLYRGRGSNFEREELLSGNPADVVRYRIGIKAVANTFRKGHRIRIAIMNALDNYTFPNSNTGGDEARATGTVVGNMALHHSRIYASHVVLPVIQTQGVPIDQEPRHRLVLEDGPVRVLDVQIPPGDTTLYHTHDTAILYVPISISPTDAQVLGGAWNGVKPTDPSRFRMDETQEDTHYASRPVTHRVTNRGDRLFRLIAITNAKRPGLPPPTGADEPVPGTVQRDSAWYRQSRLTLAPGTSTGWHTASLPTVLVQQAAGRVRVDRREPARESQLPEAGSWVYLPRGTRYQLRNEGADPATVVIVQAR